MKGNSQEEKHDQLDELGRGKYYSQSGRSSPSKRCALALETPEGAQPSDRQIAASSTDLAGSTDNLRKVPKPDVGTIQLGP
jgi:hypothetical protein